MRSSTTDSTFCNENVYLDDDTQIKLVSICNVSMTEFIDSIHFRNTQQQNYYLHTKPRVYCVEAMGPLQDKIFIEEVIYTPTQGKQIATP